MADVTVDSAAPVPAPAAKPSRSAKAVAAGELVEPQYAWQRKHPEAVGYKVILDESVDITPTGLFVQVNGEPFIIKPGEEVFLPDYLLDHLDNCVMGVPIVEPSTGRVTGYRQRKRFTYQIVGARR